MKKYDFKNKAILCETWEQMERLAEIAREQGLKVTALQHLGFREGAIFFRIARGHNGYGNFHELSNNIAITYSDFIASGVEEKQRTGILS